MVFFNLLIALYAVHGAYGSATWYKINNSPVCFGAKNDTFGSFQSTRAVTAYEIAIEKVSGGGVSCSGSQLSPFSCVNGGPANGLMGVYLVDLQNNPIVPRSPTYPANTNGFYGVNGNNVQSQLVRLVAGNNRNGHHISLGQTLCVFYGEDLFNYAEFDNSGQTCVDVYALA